jgi:glycosyltransferase involved in cell wall biosynthesis
MSSLVSAIIPTYNRATYLTWALQSVIAQRYRPLEAVVVDDGSTDETAEVMCLYRDRLADAGVALVLHRQCNGRAPQARNIGMKLASGSVFAFLDSDDLWRPMFVPTLMRLLDRHPTAGLAFCGILVIDLEDRVWKTRESGLGAFPVEGVLPSPLELILRHMPLQTSGVMVRRSVIKDIGDFDLRLPVVEDWDLWYRVSKKYDFAYSREGLACNRSHPDNLPKFDCTALTSSILMNLKHLPDVSDVETREILLDRIERQFTLLQEEVLRQGRQGNGYSQLLAHQLAPRSPRFELGMMLSQAPRWIGQSYGRMVRLLGELKRGV